MKKIIFIFLLCGAIFSAKAQSSLSISEALKQNKVKAVFTGNPKSVHYLKPLLMTLTNLQNMPQNIVIEAGIFFSSIPAEFQDITVTESMIIALKPNESQTYEISGVCTEANLAAPSEKVNYTLAPAPKPEYVELAKFIEKEGFYRTSEAQYAMWVFSNDYDWKNIYGHSDEKGNIGKKIRNQVAAMKGIKLDLTPEGDIITGEKTYQVTIDGRVFTKYTHLLTDTKPTPTCEMSGGASFSFYKTSKVRLGMFDNKGVLVREIYYNENEKPGMHRIKYAYDCEKYTDPIYHFKIIKDDHIVYVGTLRQGKRN